MRPTYYRVVAVLICCLALWTCESTPTSTAAAAPACYRTFIYKDCESCGNAGGLSCTTCTNRIKCVACADVDGQTCWWSPSGPPQPLKCLPVCPADSTS